MNGESTYNKIQINEKIDRGENGAVIRKSLMLNVREDDVKTACELYKELKATLDQGTPEKAIEIKEDSEGPKCEKCNGKMVLRQNGKKGNFFWGCSSFPACSETKPYFSEEKNETLETVQVL